MKKKIKKAVVKKSKVSPKLAGTIKMEFPPRTQVEIVRSFSFKLNAGNYESRDFFASQKAVCEPSEADRVSEALYQWCKNEVLKAVNTFRKVDSKKIKDSTKDEAEHDVE